jgi:hypothetical protein
VRISKDSVGDVLDGVGEDLEVGRAARDVDVRGQVRRLAGVGDLGLQEVVEAVVDLGDQAVEHGAALDHRQLAPGAVQRRLGGGHGGVHFGLAGFIDHGRSARCRPGCGSRRSCRWRW